LRKLLATLGKGVGHDMFVSFIVIRIRTTLRLSDGRRTEAEAITMQPESAGLS
jgi:hypothetical protein